VRVYLGLVVAAEAPVVDNELLAAVAVHVLEVVMGVIQAASADKHERAQ
jgi:hypothetical protein